MIYVSEIIKFRTFITFSRDSSRILIKNFKREKFQEKNYNITQNA